MPPVAVIPGPALEPQVDIPALNRADQCLHRLRVGSVIYQL
jgi:hypothetical protein